MSSSWNRRAAASAVFLFLFLALAVSSGHAGPIVVKMATLAPEGSSWYKVLQNMGEGWKKATDGAVTLRIYPGGVSGDEDAVIRKMRVGQLQAAAVTGIGLSYLDRSFYALHVPMMYESDEEFDYVRDRLSPVLERRLEEKGMIVLNWGDAGWVHFFAKKPFTRPSEVKAMKIFVWAGDTNLIQLYKETGFNPVPLSRSTSCRACRRGSSLRHYPARGARIPMVPPRSSHGGPSVGASHGRHDHRQEGVARDPGEPAAEDPGGGAGGG
jgi:TRAP-type C4-dicarboxylate transport system substrate-binding protein